MHHANDDVGVGWGLNLADASQPIPPRKFFEHSKVWVFANFVGICDYALQQPSFPQFQPKALIKATMPPKNALTASTGPLGYSAMRRTTNSPTDRMAVAT